MSSADDHAARVRLLEQRGQASSNFAVPAHD
jgi:hypothetical protein